MTLPPPPAPHPFPSASSSPLTLPPPFLPLTSFAGQTEPGSGICDCGKTGCPTLNWRNKNLSLLELRFREPRLHLHSSLRGDLGEGTGGGVSAALPLPRGLTVLPCVSLAITSSCSSNDFINWRHASREAAPDSAPGSDYHLIPMRVATVKQTENSKCRQECGAIQALVLSCRDVKWCGC